MADHFPICFPLTGHGPAIEDFTLRPIVSMEDGDSEGCARDESGWRVHSPSPLANVDDGLAILLAIEPPGHQACGRVAGKQVLG